MPNFSVNGVHNTLGSLFREWKKVVLGGEFQPTLYFKIDTLMYRFLYQYVSIMYQYVSICIHYVSICIHLYTFCIHLYTFGIHFLGHVYFKIDTSISRWRTRVLEMDTPKINKDDVITWSVNTITWSKNSITHIWWLLIPYPLL